MSKKRVLTPEEEESILKFYESHSIKETAIEFGFSVDWVGNFIKKKGASRNNSDKITFAWAKRLSPVDEKDVVDYYLEPNSTKRVKKKFGISDKRMYEILERNGITPRTKEESSALRKKTNVSIYGEEVALRSKEVMDKRCKTNLERYGVEQVGSLPEVIDKRKKTCVDRFGTEYPSSTPEIKKKVENTMLDRFGVKSMFLLPDVDKKKEEAVIEKYGGTSPFCSESVREKSKQTMQSRYGVHSTMLSPELRAKQAKSAGESKLEKRFKEFLINNNFTFVQQLTLSSGAILHAFDFGIYVDGILSVLVDCDGIYYHGYTSDHDGKKVNLDADSYRQMLVPTGVKFLIVLEKHEEEAERELFSLIGMSYDDYIKDVFQWCREVEFPYPSYTDTILHNTYKKLCSVSTENFYKKARYGDKIIVNFHPSVYKAHRKGYLSPYDAWKDDDVLIRCIKNRVIYKGNNLDRSKVLAGFTVTKIAPRVSIFNAYLAKYIVNKYLQQYNIIFDPFSGYSGRMLGVCSSGRKYIGQDINKITVEESISIKEFFDLDATISAKNILEDCGTYDCLFTCPPYEDKEIWGNEVIFKDCDAWIGECMHRYECSRYVFVVDKTNQYSDYVVEEIVNKSHFGSNSEYIVVIDKQ